MAGPGNAVNISQLGPVMFNGTSLFTQGNYPGCYNIGIAYSSPTFTIQGSNGTALSATNPGYIITQSPTSGQLVTTLVTANQTFTDGAAGNIDTWRAGVSPTDLQGGVSSNWAQDMPFFLYGVLGTANDIAFMISRDPRATISPVAGSISKTGTILNVAQGDFFSLAGGTIANYSSRPCVCIGSFRMRNIVTGGTIRYTVQAINGNDGIGNFQDSTWFSFPTGVNGAVAGRYWASAGVTPIFTTMASQYQITRQGRVFYNVKQELVNNKGSLTGASQVQLALPYANGSVAEGFNNWFGYSTGTLVYCVLGTIGLNTSVTSAASFLNISGLAGGFVPNSFQTNDSFEGQVIYSAFS